VFVFNEAKIPDLNLSTAGIVLRDTKTKDHNPKGGMQLMSDH